MARCRRYMSAFVVLANGCMQRVIAELRLVPVESWRRVDLCRYLIRTTTHIGRMARTKRSDVAYQPLADGVIRV
ncbi:hypothetical protein J3F83DRAFT_725374 [Trichoderma novae-zelandiae]